MEKKRIGVKDLVNIGIFAVIYFIAFFIAGITGFIPVMTVFYSAVLAVIGGIPCILFFTKADKFGMVTILCLLMGIVTFVMGYVCNSFYGTEQGQSEYHGDCAGKRAYQ